MHRARVEHGEVRDRGQPALSLRIEDKIHCAGLGIDEDCWLTHNRDTGEAGTLHLRITEMQYENVVTEGGS